jgi:hypothetical protein
MTNADDFPSLMDDTEFLTELEKVECPPPRASADRASRVALATGFATARKPVDIAPVLARDVDRWNVRPKPAIADADRIVHTPPIGQIRAAVPLFLMMLIGVCVGAASSALLLHDRVARLLALWSH